MQVTGRRRWRSAALLAAVLGVGLVAGCTGDGAADASFPEEGPRWVVLGTGEGFTHAGAADVPPGWVPLLAHEGGCALAGRGVQVDTVHEDSRAESNAALTELLDDDGAHPGEVGEEEFVVSGGVDEDDGVTLPFLVAEAADGGEATRYAARAGARLSYDGEFTTDVLQVRLDCPGSIDAQVWDGAREVLRAGLAAVGPPRTSRGAP